MCSDIVCADGSLKYDGVDLFTKTEVLIIGGTFLAAGVTGPEMLISRPLSVIIFSSVLKKSSDESSAQVELAEFEVSASPSFLVGKSI